MSDEHTPSLSDEDEEELEATNQDSPKWPEVQGYLSKWTNYIHGWQDRWVVLSNGTLSYYKSEFDTAYGCRGSMSLIKATIQSHDFDDCRFDVSINDCMYYLRARSPEMRQKWVSAIEASKQVSESGYGSDTSLRKVGSMLSLSSVTSLNTTTSSTSFKPGKNQGKCFGEFESRSVKTQDGDNQSRHNAYIMNGRGLREKLMELETFRDIVCRQIDTLQGFFDACSEISSKQSDDIDIRDQHHDDVFGDHDADDEMDELSSTPTPATMNELRNKKRTQSDALDSAAVMAAARSIDFKGEAITFKATTAGILATLAHCLEIMNKREDYWQRRLDKETDKRKRAEQAIKNAYANARKQAFIGGPDFEEGPHSALNEDEFYDAMEIALDRQDELDKEGDSLHRGLSQVLPQQLPLAEEKPHRLSKEVKDKVTESLKILHEDVDIENWTLAHDDGDMLVYRRDYEENGIVLDFLKATHVVKGVTAREMAQYFFDKDVRLEWETTLDQSTVVETLSDNTLIFHQVMKRIWPSSQRDTLFISHIEEIVPSKDEKRLENEVGHPWLVCNWSTDHDDVPKRLVRATLNVAMFTQTIIVPREEGEKLTRDHVSCKITYSANVNPGGWAPPSVVRAVSKREYPKFLRKISSCCQSSFTDKDITL